VKILVRPKPKPYKYILPKLGFAVTTSVSHSLCSDQNQIAVVPLLSAHFQTWRLRWVRSERSIVSPSGNTNISVWVSVFHFSDILCELNIWIVFINSLLRTECSSPNWTRFWHVSWRRMVTPAWRLGLRLCEPKSSSEPPEPKPFSVYIWF